MSVVRSHRQLTKRPYQSFRTSGYATIMLRRGRRAGSCPEMWVCISEAREDGVWDTSADKYRQVESLSEFVELRAQLERYQGYCYVKGTLERLRVVGTPRDGWEQPPLRGA